MQFLNKLDQIEVRFDELTGQLADPQVINDSDRYRKAAKAHSELDGIVARYRDWKRVSRELEQARNMLGETDMELRQMATEEVARLEQEQQRIEEDLKVLLLPKDPNVEKNVVLEIRAGTGGDEATLFAQEIYRMYSRYAESQHWRGEENHAGGGSAGGGKENKALGRRQKGVRKMEHENDGG